MAVIVKPYDDPETVQVTFETSELNSIARDWCLQEIDSAPEDDES